MEKNITIQTVISELYNAYDLINKTFFNSSLPTIAITIQSDTRRKLTMGWCTQKEVWGDKEGKIKMYEINLTPEFLDLDFYETMDTLMHEMVHLYNKVNNIQDVSRNGTYHNKKFKDESIKRGFYFKDDKPDKKYGWSFSKLTDETKGKLDNLNIDKSVFTIARRSPDFFQETENQEQEETVTTKRKGNSFKWYCPECKQSVRSTKQDINIVCGDCTLALISDDID